jgi:shikimate kinase
MQRPPAGGRRILGMLRGTVLGKRNIFLIGPMGSGETAVAKQLARLLRVPFYDSDTEIERRTGVDIPYIFDKEGEAGFRERERDIIATLTALEPIVLATGGGAIILPENRRALAERGFVAYLETSISQQADRVRQGRSRPLLANVDSATKLAELMQTRAPLYAEIADFIVSTDRSRVPQVAEQILRAVKSMHGES